MSNYDKIVTAPYNPGQKLKIYLSDEVGNFKCTFGVVKSVDENNRPTVKYEDLSNLKANFFNRLIDVSKVNISGKYIKHDLIYKYQI